MKLNMVVILCFSFYTGIEMRIGGAERPVSAAAQATRNLVNEFSPYAVDADHLWNRLHSAMFARTDAKGRRHVHSTDPLLYRGGTFLLKGDGHDRVLALLNEWLAAPGNPSFRDPLKRHFFQRDLWAAFDYLAWYPDDWVHHSEHEPAAKALRVRLAKAIGRLSLSAAELKKLPDNYATAVNSNEFPTDHDLEHPERPFLPTDLFDPTGAWVRYHDSGFRDPMAEKHFQGAGGRAMHVFFLRLPEGRAATEAYLKRLGTNSVQQFPTGSMVAMVRRALAVDQSNKVLVTPITELVQIRVYRRIPKDVRANFKGDFGEQDVYEFVLDRGKLFAGHHGLRPVGPDEPALSFFRSEGDPFDPKTTSPVRAPGKTQLGSCIHCHQQPGIYSVTSMRRGLQMYDDENFKTANWRVEVNGTIRAKVRRYDWGLLQGMLETICGTTKSTENLKSN